MRNQMRILQGLKLAAVLAVALTMGACANKNAATDAMANAATPGSQQDFVVNVGDRVKKGQVLARFETTELQAKFNERQSALEAARADARWTGGGPGRGVDLADAGLGGVEEFLLDNALKVFGNLE